MCCNNELAAKDTSYIACNLEEAKDIANEHLLKLSMHMAFGLFDKDQVQWRTFLFVSYPSRLQVQKFHDHVDEILEPESVVTIRKRHHAISKSVVHLGVLAHDIRWIKRRLNLQLGIIKARVAKSCNALESGLEYGH